MSGLQSSLLAQGNYFFFTGGTSGTSNAGNLLSNWDDGSGGNPNDFTSGDYFDVAGYSVNVAGMTVKDIVFLDGSNGSGIVTNNGIFTVIGLSAPTFDGCAYDFASGGTVKYSENGTTGPQLILSTTYYNIEFSGVQKSVAAITVNNQLKESSGCEILFNSLTTFGSNMTISAVKTSTFTFGFNTGDSLTDNRTFPNRNNYGNWKFNKINKFINAGYYDSVLINVTSKLSGLTIIKHKLSFTTGTKSLYLNNNTLKVNGVINCTYTQTLRGSATSSLVCGATGTLYFNQSGTDSVLRNLTINNSKTVGLGNNLKIVGGSNYGIVTVESGATLNTNGYLTLRSHAGGSAMIGNSPGTISGSINVETFIPPTARRFRFLASPVTGATAVHWRNNGNYEKYKGIQITGGGANWSTQGFDESLTNNPSAFYYNEAAAGDDTTVSPGASNDAGWTAFSSGAEALNNGKGFRVLVRGDRGIDLKGTGGPTSPIATTLKVTGSYVGSSATINVTNSGRTKLNNGINFIGNPYPCTIDWQALTLTNVHSHYLIYDPSGNRYRAWNGTTGGAGRYISSGQAFLVYCTSTSGGSITVDESDKVTNTTGGGFFQTKLTNHLKIELAYDTLNLDETFIHFRDDASNKLDQYDVRQVKNSGVNIASIDSANLAYNINSLGTLTGNRRIPLSVEGTAVSNGFQMTFNDVASFPNHKIYLTDNFKGTKTLLQEAMTVIIDITNDKSTYTNGRFFLDFEEIAQTKVAKINNTFGATLFPNPSTEDINLSFTKNYENKNVNYEINTIQGEKVLNGKLHISNDNKINIKSLSPGLYIINISNNQLSQSIQFIKK